MFCLSSYPIQDQLTLVLLLGNNILLLFTNSPNTNIYCTLMVTVLLVVTAS